MSAAIESWDRGDTIPTRILATVMLVASAALLGCSDDATTNHTGPTDGGLNAGGVSGFGNGGLGGIGGGPGGASTSGGASGNGGAATGTSMLAVCIAYVNAQCARRAECGIGLSSEWDSCFRATDDCPDIFFSPGSTRTVAGTVACTDTWKTFSCDDLNIGKVPSCTTVGTRQPGESCVYGPQCSSLACTAYGSCGTCKSLAAPGGPCPTTSIVCPDGQECSGGVCRDVNPNPLLPLEPAAAGQECYSLSKCPAGYGCVRDNPTTLPSHCVALPAPGAPCAQGYNSGVLLCADGAYCKGATCAALPGPGEPCGPTNETACRKDSYCGGAGTTCVLRLDVGRACSGDPTHLMQAACMEGLSCFCSTSACSDFACYEPRAEGAPCGDSRSKCVTHTECTGGRCVATDTLTKFAACGP